MTSRLPKLLFDALAATRRAGEFVAGMDYDSYCRSALVRSAVERQLEILGEACQRMVLADPAMRQRIPEVGLAIGLRNRLIHGYDVIAHAVVWDTVHADLPTLAGRLQAELDAAPPPDGGA